MARAFAIMLFLSAIGTAAAEDRCKVEDAVFVEPEAEVVLSFLPVGSDASATSDLFRISGGSLKLDGHVMYDEESGRPAGMIMNDCPEGDATGAELRACTIWTGVPYSLDRETGEIGLLGPEGSAAPDAILMPGLGPAIRHSAVWETSGLGEVPWDLFELKECASE